jgi:prolipoprotein diacylglyceryltransferase
MVKMNQEAFEANMFLNMGQLLSLPFIALALYMIWQGAKGRFPVARPDCVENRPEKDSKQNKKKR